MTKDTGGPAFPCHPGIENPLYDGMTLRDYFATKAMQGLMDAAMPMPEIAVEAYAMADEMLKARRA
jgi:hypothetical protein